MLHESSARISALFRGAILPHAFSASDKVGGGRGPGGPGARGRTKEHQFLDPLNGDTEVAPGPYPFI